jgi:caffeoyl-CoA O-methyltransferase
MEFLDPAVDNYVVSHSQAEPELLDKLNRETHLNVLMPRMLSGHLQGRVLSMLSHMVNPKYVMEIGTYTGYSALCLAEGLQEGGKVFTVDINEELEPMVRRYVEEAGLTDKIDFRIGKALEVLPTIDAEFDLVFIDADKNNYANYYDMVFDKVRTGGFIVADNVLWSGKVLDDTSTMDVDTKALLDYSKKIHADPRVENVLFPVRDGLMIARKK